MGYTNNWQRPTEFPAQAFAAAVRDCQALFPTIDVPLAGFDGTGDPVLEEGHVVFNGRRPTTCEPFEISRVEFDRRGRAVFWSFCKTEQLPYDICVKAALIIFAHHLGDAIRVGSDGSNDDWTEARRIVVERFGYGQDFEVQRG